MHHIKYLLIRMRLDGWKILHKSRNTFWKLMIPWSRTLSANSGWTENLGFPWDFDRKSLDFFASEEFHRYLPPPCGVFWLTRSTRRPRGSRLDLGRIVTKNKGDFPEFDAGLVSISSELALAGGWSNLNIGGFVFLYSRPPLFHDFPNLWQKYGKSLQRAIENARFCKISSTPI